jgi:Bacterial PH domain
MPAEGAGEPGDAEGAPEQVSWRVSRGMGVLKSAGVLLFVVLALVSLGDPVRLTVAGLAALILAAYALRDLVAPVRLAADHEGITVIAGFAGRHRLAWSRIERVRVDERQRFGVRSQFLEIDTGDSLYLLSRYDLDAPVQDVAETLTRLRTG